MPKLELEIKIDLNESKEVDLLPKTKRRRRKVDDYDYEDPFIEPFEGESEAVEVECKLENFFIYSGRLPFSTKKALSVYKQKLAKMKKKKEPEEYVKPKSRLSKQIYEELVHGVAEKDEDTQDSKKVTKAGNSDDKAKDDVRLSMGVSRKLMRQFKATLQVESRVFDSNDDEFDYLVSIAKNIWSDGQEVSHVRRYLSNQKKNAKREQTKSLETNEKPRENKNEGRIVLYDMNKEEGNKSTINREMGNLPIMDKIVSENERRCIDETNEDQKQCNDAVGKEITGESQENKKLGNKVDTVIKNSPKLKSTVDLPRGAKRKNKASKRVEYVQDQSKIRDSMVQSLPAAPDQCKRHEQVISGDDLHMNHRNDVQGYDYDKDNIACYKFNDNALDAKRQYAASQKCSSVADANFTRYCTNMNINNMNVGSKTTSNDEYGFQIQEHNFIDQMNRMQYPLNSFLEGNLHEYNGMYQGDYDALEANNSQISMLQGSNKNFMSQNTGGSINFPYNTYGIDSLSSKQASPSCGDLFVSMDRFSDFNLPQPKLVKQDKFNERFFALLKCMLVQLGNNLSDDTLRMEYYSLALILSKHSTSEFTEHISKLLSPGGDLRFSNKTYVEFINYQQFEQSRYFGILRDFIYDPKLYTEHFSKFVGMKNNRFSSAFINYFLCTLKIEVFGDPFMNYEGIKKRCMFEVKDMFSKNCINTGSLVYYYNKYLVEVLKEIVKKN